MANLTRNFLKGRMNKSFDERLIPDGEYLDALNVRVNSTQDSEIGVIEKDMGNVLIAAPTFGGQPLSGNATCIGAFEDGVNETIYWFVNDRSNPVSGTGVVDMVLSYNVRTDTLIYHVISVEVLNFDEQYLITGVSKVDDLLFWTDDLNPPRKINVKRNYEEPSGNVVDLITEDDISVIVKPPTYAPSVTQLNIAGSDNFLEDKFVCFAYRYKYKDGEYSALSQFSNPSFQPQPFAISDSRYTNDGMVNFYNAANVTFNVGPDDVVGVDVVFKFSDNPTVHVIDKFIKSEEGWLDGSEQTLTFSNKKIYTILPESEILRLYDNVPRRAKAQTIMGNRLMYGNYIDGYDLKDNLGRDIRTNYNVYYESESIGFEQVIGGIASGQTYSFDPFNDITVLAATATFDLTSFDLTANSVFSFEVLLEHDNYSGADSSGFTDADHQEPFSVSFDFYLTQDYDNAYNMVYSSAFQQQAGTSAAGGYLPIAQCSDGVTLADRFNCTVVPPSGWKKIDSGITAEGQGVRIVSDLANPNQFSVQFQAVRYENLETPSENDAYEYMRVINANMFFQQIGDSRSLHSNRDYEIGIVYMDDYKRATTALTSTRNTLHIPASASETKNTLFVNIPSTMTPPSWATSYKFVIKPTKLDYETIYSGIYYPDPDDDSVWVKLDGENQLKVEVGDKLTVKADATGPVNSLIKVAVLDKDVKQRDDLLDGSLPGVYMRLRPENFVIESPENLVLGCEQIENVVSADTYEVFAGGSAKISYPVFTETGGTYSRWAINAGDVVTISIWMNRSNRGPCGGGCGAFYYSFGSTQVASQNYANLRDYFVGQGIDLSTANTEVECADDSGEMTGEFIPGIFSVSDPYNMSVVTGAGEGQLKLRFFSYDADAALPEEEQRLFMYVNSNVGVCSGFGAKDAVLSVNVCIQGADNQLVFETEPAEALPDVFFESSENYPCSPTGHGGNVTNQVVGSVSGLVRTDFFNCFAFGNGVESYKSNDSITGRSFYLGERVTSTSAQDYREADRFADITYSGVYNDETNVNKLNEFNLGLANFKTLEDVYGPVQRMEARRTDILVLQEDKISYVLTGKNLLSDASGGGTLTSVPEVLGQQIARSEDYGISRNPESYAENGPTKFFTDVKRGVVLMMVGDAYSNEQLQVVSSLGMREYFRDEFSGQENTQKLGGYDLYNDEYVLNNNDIELPREEEEVPCGKRVTGFFTGSETLTVNMGGATGSVTVSVNAFSVDTTFTLGVSYNGTLYEDTITGDGTATVTFEADNPTVLTYDVILTAAEGIAQYSLTTGCPEGLPLKLILVTVTNNDKAEQQIHNAHFWSEGSFTSVIYDNQVVFGEGEDEFVISQYTLLEGEEGSGIFPMDGSVVTMASVKEAGDDFVFDYGTDKFKWLRSNALFQNTQLGISGLLDVANTAQPISIEGAPTDYTASFVMPSNDDDYLYLIYDYRTSRPITLCYDEKGGETGLKAICCECETCDSCKPFGSTALFPVNGDVCAAVKTSIFYHNGEGDVPVVSDRVYLGAGCTTPLGYGVIAVGTPAFKLRIGAGGLVTTSQPCATPTTLSGSVGAASVSDACAQSFTETYYAYGSFVYYDAGCQQPLTPGFYKIDLVTDATYEVGDNGEVLNTTNC